jgi:Kdo2-lipid IVA lauroyltransferase/acyltransferase
MRDPLEYAAAWMFLKFLRLLPRPAARRTAALIAAFFFRIRPSVRRAADFKLQLAFPDWSESERRRAMRAMIRNIGRMAAEFARFPSYSRQNMERAIVLENFENFAAAEKRGKGVLLLTGHMGAWELAPFAHALFSRPLHFLVRPVENSHVDRLINAYRCLSGNRPIAKNESARAVLRVLREGGVVGILADQNTMPEEAIFVDFFGLPAATTTGIARLARQTGAAVVPAYSYWDRSLGKYRLHYEPELALTRTGDEQADIYANTALFNRVMEDYIRRFPDQWLWVHKRWKTRPPGERALYSDQ